MFRSAALTAASPFVQLTMTLIESEPVVFSPVRLEALSDTDALIVPLVAALYPFTLATDAGSLTVTVKLPSSETPESDAKTALISAASPLIPVTAFAMTSTVVFELTAVKSVAASFPVAIVIVSALLPVSVFSVAVSCSLTVAVITPPVSASILTILATEALPVTSTVAFVPMDILLPAMASANVPRFDAVAVKLEEDAVTVPEPIAPSVVNTSAADNVAFAD